MAPFGRTLGSACLRLNVVGLASLQLLILKRDPNGFSADARSKHPADRSSVLSDTTPQQITLRVGSSSMKKGNNSRSRKFFHEESNTKVIVISGKKEKRLLIKNT